MIDNAVGVTILRMTNTNSDAVIIRSDGGINTFQTIMPAGAAADILEKSIRGGVKGVWNFAPVDLRSDDRIEVQNVHLSDSLMTLSFRMEEKRHAFKNDIENA